MLVCAAFASTLLPIQSHALGPEATSVVAVASSGAEGPGPAMVTPRKARLNALTCYGRIDDARRAPILLVGGTAVTGSENWTPTYLSVLRDRGHAVCLVDLPNFGTHDVQANSEYVATAVRTIASRSDRRLSIISHSQGAFLANIALRTWPDLSAHLDDVIGLAGVYDRGSAELARRCQIRCTPVLHQLASGSRFLASIRKRPLPKGVSYTNIGTLGDTTVTPQPAANQQAGANSIMVQDVCPGRILPISEHAMIVGDSVALALALDALDHRGTSARARLSPTVCDRGHYPEFRFLQYLATSSLTDARAGPRTTHEPALFCRHQPTCRYPRARGPLITAPRYSIESRTVTIRTRALGVGTVVVRLGGRRVRQHVEPGRLTLHIRRVPNRAQLRLLTQPKYFSVAAPEAVRWIPASP